MRDRGWIGDLLGERAQRPGVGDASMRPVKVVAPFVFAEGVQEMCLVQIKVRSSSSWREVRIHRSMIEFMRGIWMPVSTTAMSVWARMASNRAGYLLSRSRMRYFA